MRAAVKTLNIITLVLDVAMIVLCCVLKIGYYIDDSKVSSPANIYDMLWFAWIPFSMLRTLCPMISQMIFILFVKTKKQLFALLVPLYCVFGSIVFEVISLIGGTMSLDKDWTDIALTMIKCMLLFFIPVLFSVVALILNSIANRKTKKQSI